MNTPVLTFFNNKGGVGKTSLVYHLAWMYADLGLNVIAADLDPQANLTSMFLEENGLETLWGEDGGRKTIFGAIRPLLEGEGPLAAPYLEQVGQDLRLLAGDLNLSSAEEQLSSQWPLCLDGQRRAFRVVSSLWRALQTAAESAAADIILVDIGPNLGALNRACLVATDHVVVPLGADLYSLQGLRNLGPTLRDWRKGWNDRLAQNPLREIPMPDGAMRAIGYVVQQHSVRLDRPVKAYDKWIKRIPGEYRRSILQQETSSAVLEEDPEGDPNLLATIKHYRSLVPMSQKASKPIFKLNTADGALGSHAAAARAAYTDFKSLAEDILMRAGIPLPSGV